MKKLILIWMHFGYIAPNITVNVIENDKIIKKMHMKLPEELKNIVKCKNPRCITSVESDLEQIFKLTDKDNKVYRCKYCEAKYTE